jgi:hypothetical protein
VNLKQAEVPDNCTVLPNKRGTAPGMWFEKNGVIYISLPGVPNEMQGLMTDSVMPRLKERLNCPSSGTARCLRQAKANRTSPTGYCRFRERASGALDQAGLPAGLRAGAAAPDRLAATTGITAECELDGNSTTLKSQVSRVAGG